MLHRAPLLDLLAARTIEADAPARPAASDHSLRESVRRELALLFNSTALAPSEPGDALLYVGRSTLNYGLPDLAGRAASSLDLRWLAAQLAHAIRLFEPRLLADSVRVRARADRAVSHNVLSFEIDAAFQPTLAAESIELDSELDLESGVARVIERRRAPAPAREGS